MTPLFTTALGTLMPSVTAARMREIDRLATEVYGPSLLQMMEHAGRSLAEVALRELRSPPPETRVLVVAGSGGNGGGGIAAARFLSARLGRLELWLTDAACLKPAARTQLDSFRATAGLIVEGPPGGPRYDLILDAVLGYGLTGAPTGPALIAIEWMAGASTPVVALDLPSGIHPDTGEAPGAHTSATATVTLHLPKPGLASPHSGRIYVADLGIPARATVEAGAEPPHYGPAFVVPLEPIS